MARKSIGYVELEWHCPSCSTRNSGSQKVCSSCGMPQPDDVKFRQPAQEILIEDEARLKVASGDADIHCYYCGSRNAADATACGQCGADLSEGKRREAGAVVGAHRNKQAEPVNCPACGASNAPDASKCTQCGARLVVEPAAPPPPPVPKKQPVKQSGGQKAGFLGIGVVGIIGIICIALVAGYFFLVGQSEQLTGTVSGASWQRSIAVEGLVPVEQQNWRNEIPMNGVVQSCQPKLKRTADNPTANSREVCGTPYTVDQGNGFAEVVQDCKYEIYEDYCVYSVQEWRPVDTLELTGENSSPQWPALLLDDNQREGEREESYTCHFSTNSGSYRYGSSSPELLAWCKTGSQWVLEVNTFNRVTAVEPAQ
jgi:hypothetical protein